LRRDLPTVGDRKNTFRRMYAFGVSLLALAQFICSGSAGTQVPAKELASTQATAPSAEAPKTIELTRAVRPWEFLSAVGTRAGLLGNEAGRMEAWVYPLKIFRDFHLKFHVDGKTLAADSLARALITRPESSTIVYTGDTFSVR
jgi:hypothetical protein